MRNRALHDALRDFALEAAAFLTDELRDGAEIEFEVTGEGSRGGPALYRYRPLTEAFIGDRWPTLRELPACAEACRLLSAGATNFLRVNGLSAEQAEPALQAMLERLYEDATSFGFPEERFERVYSEVELTLFEDTLSAAVVAPVNGLVMEAERIELGGGLALVRGDRFDAPKEAARPEGATEPRALCVLQGDVAPDEPLDTEAALSRFLGLLTGLRLFKAGSVCLAPVGWRRHGEGRWSTVEIEEGGFARGEPLVLEQGEERDLRDFLDAVSAAELGGTVSWALARFEMGCTRPHESEALSDYLLALRALLDAGSDAGRASLAMRLAALCGADGERRETQRRIELTLALERYVTGEGRPDRRVAASIGQESPRLLVTELEDNLRAILRDVICGYLDEDLPSVADDLLLEAPEPAPSAAPAPVIPPEPAIRVRDLRKDAPPPDPQETVEFDVSEMLAAEEAHEAPEGVTASADWGFADEDPESYSAPV